MSVNISTFETSLQTKLNATTGSTSTTDFLLLSKAIDSLNTGAVVSVATTGDLPAAASNTGRFIYVVATGAIVFSNGTAWTGIPSSAEITSAVNALVNGAPGALDTLDELAQALGDDANFATTVTNALATKAPINNPTFTGTVAGITKTMVGLGNVDNTSDANKPISTATQTALDLKAPLASPTFTGTVTLPSTTAVGNVSSTELGYLDGVTSAIQTQLNAKAPTASPTFTGTVSGITASMVGLGNVTNESKPTMFNNPTFTGTVTGVSAAAVGLWNVTNESKATMFTNPAFTGTATAAIFRPNANQEKAVAVAASEIDLSAGNYFTKTISGTTTFTLANVPTSGTVAAFVLDLTNGGSATTNLWANITWASGTPPTLTASGRDVLGFFTHNGGTTWNGFVLGKAMA